MFNIEKAIEEEVKRHKKELQTLEKCRGIESYVSFVSKCTIYVESNSWNECKVLLHNIAKHLNLKYKLGNYYYNWNGDLAIRYACGDIDITLFCYESEKAIAELGKGKCHTEIVTETTKKIVCDI